VARFKWFAKEFGEPLTDALKERCCWRGSAGVEFNQPQAPPLCRAERRHRSRRQARARTGVLVGGGEMDAKTFVELATEVGIENPENLVKSAPGTPQMRQVKVKKKAE
jgi:hypothetical protein